MKTYQKILILICIILISGIFFKIVNNKIPAISFLVIGLILWIILSFIKSDIITRQSLKGPYIPKYFKVTENDTEELVVSVCMEDVDWIDKYANKYKLVTVYNKCDRTLKFKSPNVKVIKSPNIGTCDHAYLSYIIDRYDDLPTFIEFTKGWRPPTGEYHNCLPCYGDSKNQLSKLLNFKLKRGYKFFHEKNSSMTDKSKWVQSEYDNFGAWIKAHKYLNINWYVQNICNIIYGGQFGTTSEQIRRTSKDIYQSLRNEQKHQREEVDHFIERTWRVLLCRPKYNLVIVAIFKNEAVAMREWLSHYTNQGVEHFYMIDNESTDNWEECVQGFPVTIYSDSARHKQVHHYNNYFLDEVKRNSNWVMVVDLDEFVYARNGFKNIPEYLDVLDNDIGCVTILWKMFGSNGYIKQPQSIRHSFTKRRLHEANISAQLSGSNSQGGYDVGKSICRSSCLIKFDIHVPMHYGKKIVLPDQITENSLNNTHLHINHYAIQSWEWFKKVKMTRGAADNKYSDSIRTRDYFKRYDHNTVTDTELSSISTSPPTIKISIPKIIHKVFITHNGTIGNIPKNVRDAHNTWVDKNNGYKLNLWSGNDCREYLLRNFPPDIIQTFDHIKGYAWKCDFFRYCLIYKEGGWYSDWNEVCLTNNLLNKLLIGYEDGIIHFTDKDCINLIYKTSNPIRCSMTAFFGSKKYNQALKNIIKKIVYNVNTKYYGPNFLATTGPGIFGKFVNIYPSCGYYQQNFYFHNNFGKVIQHKYDQCKHDYSQGNDYRKLWEKKDIYVEDEGWYYNNNNRNSFALLFTLYNEDSRRDMYNNVLNYYVNEIKYPKENIFIVDSSGNGVSEKYVEKANQLVFNQEKYKDLIKSLPDKNGQSNYEIFSLILASEYFDFTNFTYIIKITCKYTIPEIYQVIYRDFKEDLLLQNIKYSIDDEISCEIVGIRSSKFKQFVNLIATTQGRCLEHVLNKIKVYFTVNDFPFLSNTSKYNRSDKSYVKYLSIEE